MSQPFPLFDQLNKTNHVCVHSQNACQFCIEKIHIETKLPRNYTATYFAPFEVVVHNTAADLWVSFLGKVFDLTSLAKKYDGERCMAPLIAFAGKDISHWFDVLTGDIRHFIHPVTGAKVPYCPYGPLPDVGLEVPSTKWKPCSTPPWWKDQTLCVGLLTDRVRPVRIMNMLTKLTCSLNVCNEDSMHRILERFLEFNTDGECYTWTCEDRVLNMNLTLDENGIVDERDLFTSIGLPENTYVPILMLYYNDDMKWDY